MSTGLPELPENHFWRVKRLLGGFTEIQIRKRHKYWFSTKVTYATTYTVRITPGYIKSMAGVAKSYFNEGFNSPTAATTRTKTRKRVPTDEQLSLHGDYPPKTLGGTND